MGEFGEVCEDHGRVRAGIILVAEFGQRAGDVALHERLEQVDDACPVGEAQKPAHLFPGHRAAAMGDGLVQQGERIAHRAFRRAGDGGERLGLHLHAFLGADARQMRRQHARIHPPQVEALAAGEHGHRHLADFGGGEHELHMLRRLFQRLEQAVEGRRGEHVHFVDDIDLVARHHRAIAGALDDLANVVDGGVGRGIHLQHVHVPGFDDVLAVLAHHREVEGRPAAARHGLIVQGAGEDAGGGGLSHPAHAGQDIGLGDAAGGEGVGERPDHGLLADEVIERLRPVFSRQHAIGRRRRHGNGGRRGRRAEIEAEGRFIRRRQGRVLMVRAHGAFIASRLADASGQERPCPQEIRARQPKKAHLGDLNRSVPSTRTQT